MNQNFAKMKWVAGILLAVSTLLNNPLSAQQDEGLVTYNIARFTGTASPTNLSPLETGSVAQRVYVPQPGEVVSRKKIQNIFSLKLIEETTKYITTNFTADVQVLIEYGHSTANNQIRKVFTINYDKTEGVKYNARQYFHFEGAEVQKVTIETVTTTPSTIGAFNAAEVLQFESEMRVTRYFELSGNPTDLAPSSFGSTSSTSDALNIAWAWPASVGNNHTQLEWAWLEDELASTYDVGGSVSTNLLFRNNSTRLDLPRDKTTFSIPLFYDGVGKLYYRIRAVNIKADGTRTEGPWSSPEEYAFTGHRADLNWQVRTSFAEEGKMKTVMEYYDGSLRSRQTVTKENINNTTIAAETFYDGAGRPAVQILPAPSMNTVIDYTKNLNLFNSQPNDSDPSLVFDLYPVTDPNDLKLKTITGASQYYSANNPEKTVGFNKAIPDAEGFPYTLTRYKQDGTGRIESQSGVGAAMQMGTGHETKYYYGAPFQEELDGLFGTEVGVNTHYFKNMVKDANGQMSVSYVDMHGRTIATALAGNSPSNLVALDRNQYSNQAARDLTRDLLANRANSIRNNSVESVNTILVPALTDYDFEYVLTPQALQLQSCTSADLCYDLMYNLEISVTDESGEMAPIVRKFNNVKLDADDNCSTGAQTMVNETPLLLSTVSGNTISFTETLPAGSYTIRKTLTISEASLEKYKAAYLQKALCKTEQDLIDSVYAAMLAVSDCATPPPTDQCAACNAELGTLSAYRTAYLNSIGNPETVSAELESRIAAGFNDAKSECDRLCNTTSQTLLSKRQLMLADMIPGSGQYASPSTTAAAMYNKYNIFSTANGSALYTQPLNSDKDPDSYRDEDGNIDIVTWQGISPEQQVLPGELDADLFAQMFKYPWANSLLPHHPEYDRLVFAEDKLTESYNWINTFYNTPTYAEAVTKGFIFTNALSINDPFFSVTDPAVNSSFKNTMAGWINSNFKNGVSIWQIAYGDVKCKTIPGTDLRNSCYQNAPKFPPFNDLTAAEKDQAWNVFKSFYMTARDGMVNEYIATNVPLADAEALIDEKYILHFPENNNQTAEQFDWTWYPSTPGGAPIASNLPGPATVAAAYEGRCSSYIELWRQTLLNCPALAGKTNKDSLIAEITTAMQQVCVKGSDQANPYGSSNVAPNTPNDGSPRNFEDIIFAIFDREGIPTNNLCNPYLIEFPRPYSKGPRFTKDMIAIVNSCNCDRLSELKAEALHAAYNPDQLSSFNQYLSVTYGDTLTPMLYNQMMENCSKMGATVCKDSIVRTPISCTDTIPCGCTPVTIGGNCYIDCSQRVCDSTITYFALSYPQPLPNFMQCGYAAGSNCLDCTRFSELTLEFKEIFDSPYDAAPIFSGDRLNAADVQKNVLFEKFMNYRTGFQLTWVDYLQGAARSNCELGSISTNIGYPATLSISSRTGNEPLEYVAINSIDFLPNFETGVNDNFTAYINTASGMPQTVVCGNTKLLTDTAGIFLPQSPCQHVYEMSVALAQEIFRVRKESLLASFEAAYREQALSVQEEFKVDNEVNEYHFTLYYYDMAGNLVKTVPPKGVRPDFSKTYTDQVNLDRKNDVINRRPHVLVTQYRYNSLNAVIAQNSPDAHTSHFWYDKLGRLVVSQNAQQFIDNKYSYTLFDELGRIKEVGQKPHTTAMTPGLSKNETDLDTWIKTSGGTREQITFTEYDQPYGPGLGTLMTQQNLRSRVSYTGTKNLFTDAMHYTATFYTYDVHGNVDILLQDYKGVIETGTTDRFKLMSYDYDLISGKVNKVNYQPGKTDAFYHKYDYDTENRLIAVQTSRDEIYWEEDARYNYYKHAPLARTELGKLRVQGIDYAYTLQGWLKGINSTSLDPATDIGQDGNPAARDILGFSLHYYDESSNGNNWMDYKPIDGVSSFARPNSVANFNSLYNGNIGGISMNNAGLLKGNSATTNALPLFYNYRYDQLNRLVSMQAYKGLNAATNVWAPISINDYKEAITYDPNGNILKYDRNGAPEKGLPEEMDKLNYAYYSNTNQLKQVTEDHPLNNSNYSVDIDNQADADNYTYDAIGNLLTDKAEGITAINWTVFGKIASITKSGGVISYSYDPAGNRISKTSNNVTTLYVRDASGNVMSVYESPAGTSALGQKELHLYGSSRLGILTQRTVAPGTETLGEGFGVANVISFTRGEKIFEVHNHLGNVLATVADKKIAFDIANDGTIDYYSSDVSTANDYYPFGMMMPGRKYSATSNYRYGFQNQEIDQEIWNGAVTFEYRVEDSRLGRFFSVDPLASEYPHNSPYAFAENRVIDGIELEGLEWQPVNSSGEPVDPSDKKNISDYQWVGFDASGKGLKGSVASATLIQGNTRTDYSSSYNLSADEVVGSVSKSDTRTKKLWFGAYIYGDNTAHSIFDFSGELKHFDYTHGYYGCNVGIPVSTDNVDVRGFSGIDFVFHTGEIVRTNIGCAQAINNDGLGLFDIFGPGEIKLLFRGTVGGFKTLLKGGLDFEAYKAARGGTRTIGYIPTTNKAGQTVLQRVSTEYAHVFITQRAQKILGLPNWLVNNQLNVWRMNTIQHAITDPWRFRFIRYGLKPDVGIFKKYNLFTTKFPQ